MKKRGWVFNECEALCMCVRLRQKKIIPHQLDDMLGNVLMSIADLASKMICKTYGGGEIVNVANDDDARMEVVELMLRNIDNGKVNTSNPHSVVNLFITTAVNRYRNIARNRNRRFSLRPMKMMSDVLHEGEYLVVADIHGNAIQKI